MQSRKPLLSIVVAGLSVAGVMRLTDHKSHTTSARSEQEMAESVYYPNACDCERDCVECGPCEAIWTLSLDALYLRGKVGGTSFAHSNNEVSATAPIHGVIKQVNMDSTWGIRVGAMRGFDCGKWALGADYTYFRMHGSEVTGAGLADSLVPTRSALIPTLEDQFVGKAKSQYGLEYSNIYVGINRPLCFCDEFTLIPNLGIRGLHLDQKQTIRYTQNPTMGVNADTIKDKSNFLGIGPRFGFGLDWGLGCGFSLQAALDGSLLYGLFHVKHLEKLGPDVDVNRIELKDKFHCFSPAVHEQIGLVWAACCQGSEIEIGMLYEGEYLWRQNQMLLLNDKNPDIFQPASEDVAVHGLTFKFSVTF